MSLFILWTGRLPFSAKERHRDQAGLLTLPPPSAAFPSGVAKTVAHWAE